MELRHLRYFVAVAETGSVSKAAEKLFIAQPPLSSQIRQLEEEIGTALFTRHPKGVRLTAAGAALLPEALGLLDRAARLADTARQTGDGPSGTFSMGFVPSASSIVLPGLVHYLRKHHPRLTLDLREMISDEQTEALANGSIDAGIARVPARNPRVLVACVMPDPFCLALPAATAAAWPRTIDLRDLAGETFVGFTRHRGPAYFDQAIQLCTQAGFSPRIRYQASTVHGVLDLVGAGLGVALVPASTALLRRPAVRVRSLLRANKESLALLGRKADRHPLMSEVQAIMATLFADVQERVGIALRRG